MSGGGPGSAWPPPTDLTPTGGLPSINDPSPPSRLREILAVLGIIASVAVILVAVYPFVTHKDKGSLAGLSTTTLPPGVSTTLAGAPVPETTVDPTLTTPPATAPPSAPPVPLVVAAAEASCTAPDSSDSHGTPVSFAAANLIDGNTATAWRCAGDGSGQALTFTLAAPSTVTQLGAIPGFAAIDPFNGDDRFLENRRVVSARWSCLGPDGAQTASAIQTFADDRAMQTTPVNGFSGCAVIRFEVTGATPAGRRDFIAVSEVTIGGSTP